MAPISTDLVGLAFTEQPTAAFLSIVILFIASIVLLVLCASCKKHSFELEKSSAPVQQKPPSTLVSVARMNDSAARHNPTANEITGDEMGYEVEDEGNVEVSQGGIVYKPWRSHTLTHGSSLQVNGGVGAMTGSS